MTKYPGNEFDPAEWLRAWRRVLGAILIMGAIAGLMFWVDSLAVTTRTAYAFMVGAFVGAFAGLCVVAWAIFVIGRPIARSLGALLALAEAADRKRMAHEDELRRRTFE